MKPGLPHFGYDYTFTISDQNLLVQESLRTGQRMHQNISSITTDTNFGISTCSMACTDLVLKIFRKYLKCGEGGFSFKGYLEDLHILLVILLNLFTKIHKPCNFCLV